MKRWEALLTHAGVVFVTASGLVYGVMKYLMTSPDSDSRLGHPWQPGVLKTHLLVAPFVIFALGIIFRAHALVRLRSGETDGRKTGLSLLYLATPLVLSGYVLQALTGDGARQWTGWIHTGLGLLFGLGYSLHPLGRGASKTPGRARRLAFSGTEGENRPEEKR